MLPCFTKKSPAIPIEIISVEQLKSWCETQTSFIKNWIESSQTFKKPGDISLIPDKNGHIERVLFLKGPSFWEYGILAEKLPPSLFEFVSSFSSTKEAELACLAWALASYKYKTKAQKNASMPQLIWPKGINQQTTTLLIESIYLVRNLINKPASELTPSNLTKQAKMIAESLDAKAQVIENEKLLKENYPAIYAVGKSTPYCSLVDFTWGNPNHPKLTLIGKGVCFDTGGLNIKPASAMRQMKKDMGGAAHILALAQLIILSKIPVRLRVLLPIVENSISPQAMHPGDIISTRKGLTVEIGHTDAEGRLILADCLAEADNDHPDLVIDCATLTGAARIALGPDIPVVFSSSQELAQTLIRHGIEQQDPLWQLPLWPEYHDFIKSKVADLNNDSSSSYGGAITAALFLSRFIKSPWIHIDMMAWNMQSKPARPEGGEAMGLRALFHFIEERFRR